MHITHYDSMKKLVFFSCNQCQYHSVKDVADMLTDNCVIRVEVVCSVCGKNKIMYILNCNDIAYARDLQGKLEALHAEDDV